MRFVWINSGQELKPFWVKWCQRLTFLHSFNLSWCENPHMVHSPSLSWVKIFWKSLSSWDMSVQVVSCAVRGPRQCFRDGRGRRSLWRSADSDRQITSVSRTNGRTWQTSVIHSAYMSPRVCVPRLLPRQPRAGYEEEDGQRQSFAWPGRVFLLCVPQVRSPCWWTGPELPL